MDSSDRKHLTHDQSKAVLTELRNSIKTCVDSFNSEAGQHPDLPAAKFYELRNGYQVSRERDPMEQYLRERRGKSSQPSKRSLTMLLADYFHGMEIREDEVEVDRYWFDLDEDEHPIFCRVEDDATFSAQEITERFLKPFLFDRC